MRITSRLFLFIGLSFAMCNMAFGQAGIPPKFESKSTPEIQQLVGEITKIDLDASHLRKLQAGRAKTALELLEASIETDLTQLSLVRRSFESLRAASIALGASAEKQIALQQLGLRYLTDLEKHVERLENAGLIFKADRLELRRFRQDWEIELLVMSEKAVSPKK